MRALIKMLDYILENYPNGEDSVFVTAWIVGNYFRTMDAFSTLDITPVLEKHKELIEKHLDSVIQHAVVFHNEAAGMTDVFRGAIFILSFLRTRGSYVPKE